MLVVVVLHLSELRTDLEVHRSRGNMDLTEDDADALRTQVCAASGRHGK
jgi:hypothetical protein